MKRSNRRLAALSMAAIMAASVTACQSKPAETTAAPEEPTTAAESTAPAAAEGGAYTAGTYSASEQGFGGPVTVTITTSDSEITDVAIEGADETPGVGGAAFEPLQQAILDAQSAEIDAVSGATITSDAVKKAAANAIAQAKGELPQTPVQSWHLPQVPIPVRQMATTGRWRSV